MGRDARGAAAIPDYRRTGGKKNVCGIIIQNGRGLSPYLSISSSLFQPLNPVDFRELITTEVCFLELYPRYRAG